MSLLVSISITSNISFSISGMEMLTLHEVWVFHITCYWFGTLGDLVIKIGIHLFFSILEPIYNRILTISSLNTSIGSEWHDSKVFNLLLSIRVSNYIITRWVWRRSTEKIFNLFILVYLKNENKNLNVCNLI